MGREFLLPKKIKFDYHHIKVVIRIFNEGPQTNKNGPITDPCEILKD